MSLSYYNPHSRYKKRFVNRLAKLLLFMGVAGFFIGIGFLSGKQYATQEISYLQNQVNDIREQRDALQEQTNEMLAQVQTANTRFDDLQNRYEQQFPKEGALGELIELVNKRIEEGASPERLAFILRSSRSPRNCAEPDTRRFIISTPAYKGPESQLEISDGGLVIKGSGESATNASGAPEAWYNPSKRVSIEFVKPDGTAEKKSGVMPIYHSVVSGGREYRFTIEGGARSFAKVTFDSCDYP